MLSLRRRIEKYIRERAFLKSVATLVSGTVIGYGVTFAVLPILTRLYSPESFGVLASFSALSLMISNAACLRLDVAIPTAVERREAEHLFVLAVFFAVLISSITYLALLFFPVQLIASVPPEEHRFLVFILALSILAASTYNILQFWATRERNFRVVAKTRVSQSIYGAVIQAGSGLIFNNNPFGLIVGQVASASGGVFKIYRTSVRGKLNFKTIQISDLVKTFRKFDRYPKYSTAEAFFNGASVQLPIVLISSIYIGAEAGLLMLAMRVMQAPMRLVGSSIGQVYLSEASAKHQALELASFTTNVIGALLKTGVGPIVFFGVISPVIFPYIFGADWARAGVLISWMTPWFVMQFISSPISMALNVTGNQRLALGVQVIGFLARSGFVLYGIFVINGFVSELYAISGFLFYLGYFYVIVCTVNASISGVFLKVFAALPFIGAWAFIGAVLNFVLPQFFG